MKNQKPISVKLRIPQLIVDARQASSKLLKELVPACQSLNARIHVLGKNVSGLHASFSLENALEAADMWLVLGEELPMEFPVLVEQGIVPIFLNGLHPEAKDYDPVEERGNAFLFNSLEVWPVYHALVRATENFAFSYDWGNLKRSGKEFLRKD